jgi:hypothetical protein
MPALEGDELRITAVCDPNRMSDDYVEWFEGELRDRMRTDERSVPQQSEALEPAADRLRGGWRGRGAARHRPGSSRIVTPRAWGPDGLIRSAAFSRF